MLVLTDEDRLEEIEVMVLRRNKNDVIIDASKVADKEIVLNRTPLLGAGIKIKPIRPGDSNSEEKKSINDELTICRTIILKEYNKAPTYV